LSLAQNVVVGGFSECSGLEMQLKTEDYEEGGNNGTVLHFPKRTNWTNLRLKRGAALSDELWQWHFGFVEGRGKRRDGIVTLQDDEHKPVAVWHFVRGLPVKWTGPSLNAMQSQVAIEEIEIAHEGLRMQLP
jgi:phage tail-like protein